MSGCLRFNKKKKKKKYHSTHMYSILKRSQNTAQITNLLYSFSSWRLLYEFKSWNKVWKKYDSSTQINKSLQMPTLAGYSLLDSYAGPRTFIRSWKTKYPGTHFFAPILFFFTQWNIYSISKSRAIPFLMYLDPPQPSHPPLYHLIMTIATCLPSL